MERHRVGVQRNIFTTIIHYANACRGKKMKPYVEGKYLGLLFQSVVSTLQLLHFLLGSVVFSHVGPLRGDGLQRTVVAQYFLIEELE